MQRGILLHRGFIWECHFGVSCTRKVGFMCCSLFCRVCILPGLPPYPPTYRHHVCVRPTWPSISILSKALDSFSGVEVLIVVVSILCMVLIGIIGSLPSCCNLCAAKSALLQIDIGQIHNILCTNRLFRRYRVCCSYMFHMFLES